jgi:hypothetical protein
MSRNLLKSLVFLIMAATACMAGSDPASAAWAAVAADSRGAWGYAVGQPDQATAERLARSGCGNRRCRSVGSAPVSCIAYWHSRAGGGYRYGVGINSNGNAAMNTAARGCGHPGLHCIPVKLQCG